MPDNISTNLGKDPYLDASGKKYPKYSTYFIFRYFLDFFWSQ